MTRPNRKTIYEALGREPVHPFPARMAAGVALELVAGARKPLRVLDPMMGSGTALAIARAEGHRAIGVDVDPLSVLIAKVWTTTIDPQVVRDKALEVLERARVIFKTLRVRDAYPNADEETRQFIRYWFDGYSRRQLFALAVAIRRVRNAAVRDALWCAFSRLIITKQAGASLAMDLSHSRPHKRFTRAPAKPFRGFLNSVERVVRNCIVTSSKNRGPSAWIRQGDARRLAVKSASIDLVITSPPYLNAIDYIRCSKFSLVWMGYRIGELRELRSDSLGTERAGTGLREEAAIGRIVAQLQLNPTLSSRDQTTLANYIDDMRRVMYEIARVLSPGGKAVYVIGENTIRGTFIRNSLIVVALARICGLKLYERRTRMLPANRRYLPPPSRRMRSASLNGRIRREVVLSFRKPA